MGEQVISKISLREYIIDFFGALMPGLIAIFLMIMGCVIPLMWCFADLEVAIFESNKLYSLSERCINFISTTNFVLLLLFVIIYLIISFIAGVIYNRRDIKLPDRNSYIRTILSFEDINDMDNWIVNPKGLKEKLIKYREENSERNKILKWLWDFEFYYLMNEVKVKDIQFPYTALPKYLQVRGYDELAKRIPWYVDEKKRQDERKKKEIMERRSKTFINILKNRIYLKSTENYNFIIKHEGEIRMSATLWHLSKTVKSLSLIGISFCVISIIITGVLNTFNPLLIVPLLLSVLAIYVSLKTKIRIEGFLHYQRVREIFYVLTTAQAVSKKPFGLFDFNLNPTEIES